MRVQVSKVTSFAAKEQAKTNPWFDKVLKHQLQFEKLWSQARHYRNVISE